MARIGRLEPRFRSWILHLKDHQCHPCQCHPVSLCLLQLPDHPQQYIIHYLITYLQAYLLHPLPTRLPFLPSPRGRLSCYHPLLLLVSPIPWSLFWFQTPFGWSIGPSVENDSEVVWTVIDSLLGGQLLLIPLIYSSLHWLMERGCQRSTFCYGSILTQKQINTFSLFLVSWGQNGLVILIPHMSVLGRKVNSWRKMSIMWLGSSWPRQLNIQDGWMIDQHLFKYVKSVLY